MDAGVYVEVLVRGGMLVCVQDGMYENGCRVLLCLCLLMDM